MTDTHPAIKALLDKKKKVPFPHGIGKAEVRANGEVIGFNQGIDASIDTIRSMIVGEVVDGFALVPKIWPEHLWRELGYALSLPSPAAQYEKLVEIATTSVEKDPIESTTTKDNAW